MFATRLVSGIVLVIAAVLIVGYGGPALLLASALISLIGLFELYRVMRIEWTPLAWAGYGATVLYYGLPRVNGGEGYVTLLVIGLLMLLMALYVFTFPRYRTEEIAVAFFGFFYVSVMLSYLYLVRQMPDGKYLVWLIFLSSWGCDTCAYCVGTLFGRHRLTPVLSPKKSVEGAVGGAVGAGILGAIYGLVLGGRMTGVGSPAAACAAACAVSALISQIGDLAASAIKRNHQVKDYGRLIPGHGGVLDRFDSVLFTAPAVYFVFTFLR